MEQAYIEEHARKERIITRRLVKPRLDIKYPQVVGLRNGFVRRMINNSILDTVYDLIRMQGYVQDPTKSLTGGYHIKLHQNGLLSLLYDNYGYAKGAAHGITYQSSQTFSTEDGTEYKLGDLFKPGSDYIDRLSDIIKREFKARDIPMIAEFQSIGENQPFYLTEQAVVIYFQLYEYTPYVYGFPTFEIPFREVMDIIEPNGPIGKLL
ncbi:MULTISPECIES: DUF3298 and DUF4163 domain-containing protein [unclassified Paenibacillus]|uniref:DUF3298 and DUF4163 domain-containing protein n=1 Tax=unclassified Paenibacillus TaxID=185978 RepID=UPI001AE72AE2|nr:MULTISPECIES: DUF3298 and DUF4163 domain-containing protein [unclassified Paenibacillus]MBP1157204.1 hypothetical protein [Paenibacillus sp. PvP091]MBP1172057.1 hypothetical protein [Paenibacillus sp. PvR098]MBP2438438.1 hypothetical protein [Paenibacillus sp. PvP052]